MKKQVYFSLMVMGFLSLLLLQPVSAQPGEGRGMRGKSMKDGKEMGMKRQQHFEEMAQELKLTQEQRDKIEANRKKFKEEGKQVRETIQEKKEALRAELNNPQLDMTKINQLQTEIKTLAGQREDQRLQAVLDMRAVLTPEQYQQFQSKMDGAREKFQKRWQKGAPGEPPMTPDDPDSGPGVE